MSSSNTHIDATNYATAIDLLAQGFPRSTTRFWQQGLERMLAAPAHRDRGEPIGSYLKADGRAVGVALTAVRYETSPALADHPPRRHVNFSSWYVEPEHRARFPLLLRRLLKDRDAIYTDLTPTPEVWPILEASGFVPLNAGVSAFCVPLAAALHVTAKVVPWQGDVMREASAEVAEVLAGHQALGCLAFVIVTSDRTVPVLVKPVRLRGLPGAHVIYCDDNDLLRREIGALARRLLGHGIGLVVLDRPLNGAKRRFWPIETVFSDKRRYVRGAAPDNRTNYTGTELVYFDL